MLVKQSRRGNWRAKRVDESGSGNFAKGAGPCGKFEATAYRDGLPPRTLRGPMIRFIAGPLRPALRHLIASPHRSMLPAITRATLRFLYRAEPEPVVPPPVHATAPAAYRARAAARLLHHRAGTCAAARACRTALRHRLEGGSSKMPQAPYIWSRGSRTRPSRSAQTAGLQPTSGWRAPSRRRVLAARDAGAAGFGPQRRTARSSRSGGA